MILPSSSSDTSPLLGHLKTLYPLACLRVGPEKAPTLLLRVYEQAAEQPPAERPDDLKGWLLTLLYEHSEAPSRSEEEPSEEATGAVPGADESTPDPLRRDVAETLLEDALPVALTACAPRERFLLAMDAFGSADDTRAPNSTTIDVSDAHATLWRRLRTVLSEPEYALVDEFVSDAALRTAVRKWVATRFSSVPGSLRSRIRALLETARPSGNAPANEHDPSSTKGSSSLLDRLPARPRPRALLLTFLIGVLVLAGGIGAWYATQPSPAPSSSSTSLVAFSAEQARAVTPELKSKDQAEAEAFVESTWGRRIQVPSIEDARLQGVGRARTDGGAEIPVLLYANAGDSTRIATFAYSYALVDQIEATATLDAPVRKALARRNHLVADTEASHTGLLWRDRDDIFVVVAPSTSADSLRTRLRP